MELEKTVVLLRRATIEEGTGSYVEQPTQLTPIKQRQQNCKENHITRQNQARLQKDLERIRFEQLGSVKSSPAPTKPLRTGRAHPKPTLAAVVFEVIVSNEERIKLRLREGDDLAKLAGEVVLRHRLDDVRANRLLQAMQEAVRAKTSEEEGWEKHWDAKRQRWYAHHPASGRSKWAE